MRRKFLLPLGTLVIFTAVQGFTAAAKKKNAAETAQFFASLTKDQKVVQALNRLTFGPRAGDFEDVKRAGLKRWIDQQLHPETIAESPKLEEKIRWLDSLRMTQAEMTTNYPPRQLVLAMSRGRVPYPNDPEQRAMIQRIAARYDRQAQGKPADAPKPPKLDAILTPEQMRAIQRGTPEEKIEMFRSLSKDKQEQFIESMPQGMRFQMINFVPPDVRRKLALANNPDQVVVNDLVEGKLLRAVYSNRQLEEVLTDFWFNHFNVFLDKGADRYLTTVYERDAIRKHVFGKFHDLLLATAESPAMLFYLDNWESAGPPPPGRMGRGRTRGLNENYGRELMELHTLGVDGGYSQKDVTEVARCFTGWTIKNLERGGEYLFNPVMHDKGEKTVLGVKIPAGGGREDGLKVLDIVSHHPSTARFISRKLAQRFVADNPPPSLIDKMAKTFHDKDGDLREVMKTMFNSPEFWSRGAFRSKVKSPLEMVASSLRALNADVDFGVALIQQIANLGEPLYRKQEPTGYSNQSQEWVNSASLLARMNFGLALVSNKIPGVKIDAARFSSEDPKKIARTLLLADLPPKAEAAIEAGLNEQNSKFPASKPMMVAGLTIGSPEFQKR
jgi:uncharacterized protein (DUF1800 family)